MKSKSRESDRQDARIAIGLRRTRLAELDKAIACADGSVSAMAELVGVSRQTVYRWKGGDPIGPVYAQRIAIAVNEEAGARVVSAVRLAPEFFGAMDVDDIAEATQLAAAHDYLIRVMRAARARGGPYAGGGAGGS